MSRPTFAKPDSEHGNSIGLLRLFFAGLVVYVHCFRLGGFSGEFLWEWSHETVSAGTLSVQCFFVLSGALITRSWIRSDSLVRYLWHRALRLLPALWVCLAVTAFILTPLLLLHTPEPRKSFFELEPSAWGYVWRNLFRPRTQIAIDIYPNGGPWAGDWNGSLWTLFYEGSCYLIITALGLIGLLSRFRTLGITALIAALGLYSLWGIFNLTHGNVPFPSLFLRLFDTAGKELTFYFLSGTLWALLPEMSSRFLRVRWAGPVALAVVVVAARTGVAAPILPWALAPILFWLAEVLPFGNFERWVGGDYSYGLYVYGYPLQQVLSHFGVNQFGFYTYLLASFAATGFFAVASWHLVERRALALKNVFGPAHQPLSAKSALA